MNQPSTPEKLRIAMFTEAYPPIISGVAVATATLVDGLRALGHEVDVYAPWHPEEGQQEPGLERLRSVAAPEDFNYSTLPGLVAAHGDPWAAMDEDAGDLAAALKRLG